MAGTTPRTSTRCASAWGGRGVALFFAPFFRLSIRQAGKLLPAIKHFCMQWKVLESEYLFNQPWLTIRKEKCELPNGTLMPAYYILEYPSWVNVFALTSENELVMVKQYRHGLGTIGLELPGGVVDQGEEPEQAVRRELLEETGYTFDDYTFLGRISANPATSNNYTYFYLARNGRKVAGQQLDQTEDIEVVTVPLEEAKQLLRDHQIYQSLHATCMFYALEKLGELKY
jgi:ADP-ribose pyrophosphatase